MFRLLGFLVGSLVSMGLLVYLVGMPRFDGDADQELVARFDAAVEKLKDKRDGSGPLDEPAPDDRSGGEAQAAPTAPATDSLRTAATPQNEDADDARKLTEPTAETAAVTVSGSEPEWYEFWTPFSSDIAARGFVNRLESVTGLDYRVTRVATGRYQVEFAYRDPADLDASLSQIAAATGLDVSAEYP